MQLNDQQLGRPAQLYKETKANIEAITGLAEGCVAYATDTDEQGTYDGSAWTWGGGGGGAVASVTGDGVDNTDPANPVLTYPTTADVPDSVDKRYVTDAQLVVIGNTSNTNTGDQTLVSLGISEQDLALLRGYSRHFMTMGA